MKPFFFLQALSVLSLTGANAAVVVTSGSLGALIPDDTETGFVHTLHVADSFEIASVSMSLNLTAAPGGYGWTGDLYCYLQHGTDLSVLLNRPGRSAGSAPAGYADNRAINVSFSDDAANGDIHNYRLKLTGSDLLPLAGTLGGAWQPDGRATDPGAVSAGDSRTALLGQFGGRNSAGDWTLFLADLSGDGQFRLDSWSISFDAVTPVPEPAQYAMLTALGLLSLAFVRSTLEHRPPHVHKEGSESIGSRYDILQGTQSDSDVTSPN